MNQMTKVRLPLSLVLVTIFLAACAAGTPAISPVPPQDLQPAAATPTPDEAVQATAISTQASVATALPVATSRGPELHASDPSTVQLASGELQLVEFFRFT